MGIMDDLAAVLAAGAARRRHRRRREPVPVRATPWLAVGVGAVVAQVAVLGAALVWLGYWAWVLSTDDLLFALAFIVAPVALAGLGAGLSTAGWLVGLARRLHRRDGTARLELGVAGVGGLMVGMSLAWVGLLLPALVVLTPSLVATVVAVASDAWQPLPPVDWARWDGDDGPEAPASGRPTSP